MAAEIVLELIDLGDGRGLPCRVIGRVGHILGARAGKVQSGRVGTGADDRPGAHDAVVADAARLRSAVAGASVIGVVRLDPQDVIGGGAVVLVIHGRHAGGILTLNAAQRFHTDIRLGHVADVPDIIVQYVIAAPRVIVHFTVAEQGLAF